MTTDPDVDTAVKKAFRRWDRARISYYLPWLKPLLLFSALVMIMAGTWIMMGFGSALFMTGSLLGLGVLFSYF